MRPDSISETATGRLLLVGGNHQVARMFRGETPPSATIVDTFHANIKGRADYCDARGIAYQHHVFPDPLILASDELPDPVAYSSFFLRHFCQNDTQVPVHYPFHILAKSPEMRLMTDTHYSPLANARLGADIAAQMIGLDPAQVLGAALDTCTPSELTGDLGAQCIPPRSERITKPRVINGLQRETNGMVHGNNGIIDLLISDFAVSDRVLLIFGDSFFRSMLTELARYWRKIAFFRTPYFHPDIVDAMAPDDLVTGMAERYLGSIAPDSEAPNMLDMPLLAGRPTHPSAGFDAMFAEFFNGNTPAPLHADG